MEKQNLPDKLRAASVKRSDDLVSSKRHQDRLNSAKALESAIFQSFQSLVTVLQGNGTKAEAITMVMNALDKLDKVTDDNKTELELVKSGLTTLEAQLKDIPTASLKQMPKFLEQRETVKVTNLEELTKGLNEIKSAIKNQKLSVQAPKVNVEAPNVTLPAPIVNVPETDLEPLTDTMLNVLKAVKAIKPTPATKIDLSKLEKESKVHSKLLKEIVDKPSGGGGGGGGGGQAWTAVNPAGTPMPLNLDASGNLKTTSSGGGGGAVTIADGADIAEGSTTDAAVTAGSSGTVSGKLRQISADIATSNTLMATSAKQDIGNASLSAISAGIAVSGATVPGSVVYIGGRNSAGNIAGANLGINSANSAGNQYLGASLIAQVDDVSPTSITENNFGNIRMATDRSILVSSRATAPSQTSVSASISSVNLLASNINRKGATITNDSASVMYLKLGATASTTSYTITLNGAASAPFSYYEVPFGYIGAIDAIWVTAVGNARITELT